MSGAGSSRTDRVEALRLKIAERKLEGATLKAPGSIADHSDLPAILDPGKRVNIRKALAGIYLLDGRGSMLRCLMLAGYSRSTARVQVRNGLTGDQCLAEAAKMDEGASPAKLLEGARRRASQTIALMDPARTQVRDTIRLLEVVEKFHGGHELSTTHPVLALKDRLASLVALLLVARERGLPVPALPPSFTDAEIVANGDADPTLQPVNRRDGQE